MKQYSVVVNGISTTLQLTDEDAEKLGLTATDKPADVPTKARRPQNKSTDGLLTVSEARALESQPDA